MGVSILCRIPTRSRAARESLPVARRLQEWRRAGGAGSAGAGGTRGAHARVAGGQRAIARKREQRYRSLAFAPDAPAGEDENSWLIDRCGAPCSSGARADALDPSPTVPRALTRSRAAQLRGVGCGVRRLSLGVLARVGRRGAWRRRRRRRRRTLAAARRARLVAAPWRGPQGACGAVSARGARGERRRGPRAA